MVTLRSPSIVLATGCPIGVGLQVEPRTLRGRERREHYMDAYRERLEVCAGIEALPGRRAAYVRLDGSGLRNTCIVCQAEIDGGVVGRLDRDQGFEIVGVLCGYCMWTPERPAEGGDPEEWGHPEDAIMWKLVDKADRAQRHADHLRGDPLFDEEVASLDWAARAYDELARATWVLPTLDDLAAFHRATGNHYLVDYNDGLNDGIEPRPWEK